MSTTPPQPAGAGFPRGAGGSQAARAAERARLGGRQAVPRRAEEGRLRRRRSDDSGASLKKDAAALAGGRLTCRSTVKGVRRRKPRPRPPATLIKKERYDCGYSSAPDEPSNGARTAPVAEYQTPPATPVQYDSEDDFFSPKKFREPGGLRAPSLPDDDLYQGRSSTSGRPQQL